MTPAMHSQLVFHPELADEKQPSQTSEPAQPISIERSVSLRELVARVLLHTGRWESMFLRCIRYDYEMWADWLRKNRGYDIGEGTTINPKAKLMDGWMVSIGRNCSISACTFVTHSGGDRVIENAWGYKVDSARPIVVGDNCIVGINATIMYGVTIGDNCVIGAGSYVCRDVAAGTIVRPPSATIAGTTEEYVQRLSRKAPVHRLPIPARTTVNAPRGLRAHLIAIGFVRTFGPTLLRYAFAFGTGALLMPSHLFE